MKCWTYITLPHVLNFRTHDATYLTDQPNFWIELKDMILLTCCAIWIDALVAFSNSSNALLSSFFSYLYSSQQECK
jgi:hypothetical protein